MKFNLTCYLCDRKFVREISSKVVHKSKRFCGEKCQWLYRRLASRELRPCLYCWKPLFVERWWKHKIYCNLDHSELHRFHSSYKVVGDCWLWTGKKDIGGYASQVGGVMAHRYSFRRFVGPIKGKHVLHRCDVRHCVNPKHLFSGTHQDNMADRNSKNRFAFGEKIGQSRLTDSDIPKIRKCYFRLGVIQKDIGRMFGVSKGAIQAVVEGRTWRHISSP